MKNMMKPLVAAVLMAGVSSSVLADEQQTIQALEKRIQELEETLNERLEALADEMEKQQNKSHKSNVNFGGYGELNYRNLDINGEDVRELDFRRWVLFVGYNFNSRMRFHSELEVEHTVVPGSEGNGAVELEQAYLEFDLSDNQQLRTGIQVMPLGIISETHEPTFYYGVERPVIETTIIPTTWFASGLMYRQRFESGISYDVFISEGIKTDDPTTNANNDPFDIKAGKQKSSFASAFDLATTARIRYTGIPGLELAAYAQYQPDIDQSAEESYAESATLLGGHAVYQLNSFTTKVLYAQWSLDGDAAKSAGKDHQAGGYIEVSWKPLEQWGVFARQNNWSQENGIDPAQTDAGVNFWPTQGIVFKADIQLQNDDAGNADGFNLGMGYQF